VIKSFRHSGLESFFRTGSKAGIQAAHAARLRRQLSRLDAAKAAQDMNLPGWKLHRLTGNRSGEYVVAVSGNWRLVFRFEDGDAILVNYEDYH
jgi:toxin HigB-1